MEIDYTLVENARINYQYILRSQFLSLAKYFVNMKITPSNKNHQFDSIIVEYGEGILKINEKYNDVNYVFFYHERDGIKILDKLKMYDWSKQTEEDKMTTFSMFKPDEYTLINVIDEKTQKEHVNVSFNNFDSFFRMLEHIQEREKNFEELKEIKRKEEIELRLYPTKFECECGNKMEICFTKNKIETSEYTEIIVICNLCKKELSRKREKI